MKSLENEGKLSMFNSVKRMLENKTIPVNDTGMKPIQQVGNYFDEVYEEMRLIRIRNEIPFLERAPYKFPVDNLRKMLEFAEYSLGGKSPQQIPELERAIKDFKEYTLRFRELEDEPKRFFSDESRVRKVYGICKKMSDFYQRLVDEEDFRELETPED